MILAGEQKKIRFAPQQKIRVYMGKLSVLMCIEDTLKDWELLPSVLETVVYSGVEIIDYNVTHMQYTHYFGLFL